MENTKLSAPCNADDNPILEGSRTETLTTIAETMIQNDCDISLIYDMLVKTNRQRCRPPLVYKRLASIAASVCRSAALREGGVILDSGSPDQIAQAMLNSGCAPIRCYDDVWMILTDGRYRPVDADEIRYRIYQFGFKCKVRSRSRDCTDELGYSKLWLTPRLVSEVLESLSLVKPARIPLEYAPPIWLQNSELRPGAEDIIALDNVLIDISGDEPAQVDPTEDFFTQTYLPIQYDPQAACPIWLEQLTQWFQVDPFWDSPDVESGQLTPTEESSGKTADQVSISILQEWFGFALTRKTCYPRILGLAGPARGGKETIAKILQALMGRQNTISLMLPQLTGKVGPLTLSRKHAAIVHCADLSRANTRMRRAIDGLVSIVQQDYLQPYPARQRLIRMDARILLITDYLSNLFDPEDRLNEWMIRLQTAPGINDKQDFLLEQKLLAELPGIFNWALEGYFRLGTRGYFLDSPAEQRFRRMDQMPDESIGDFVHQCCQLTVNAKLICQDLYQGYKHWSSLRHCPAMGRTRFYEAFLLEFPDCIRSKVRLAESDSNPQWVFQNIEWKPPFSFRQGQSSQKESVVQIQDKQTL
jgi:putative DNA primase/helicase